MNATGKSSRRTRVILCCLMISVFFFTFLSPASADDRPASKRPKIGLVLGGGGAKGTAHIGVIKVLEELRIPIDYIAGTSMGGVVGSFYAAGMSAAELETVLTSLDWEDLFNDNPGRDEIPFRRKQEDFTYMTKFALGVKDGIRLPPSLMAAQKIGVLFQSVLLPVAGITDFDKLPIPYRAVAADLETGDMVVLRSGSLADAARASMSVPGVFPPAEIAGRFLIDGGIVRNLPVDIVRAMGADILIVVDVGKPLPRRDKITSSLAVLGQMLDIMMKTNVDAQIATLTNRDVFIRPELGTLESGDFQRGKEGAGYGEVAARKQIDQLRRYSVSEQEYAAFQAKHRFHDIAKVRIGTITVEGERLTNIPLEAVTSRVKLKEGEELTVEQLQKRVSLLYGMGEFERVDLHVSQKGDALDINLKPIEKSWGPNYMKFGLNLETNFSGGSDYNILIDYTRRWLNPLGAEWKTLLQVGNYNGLFTEFYQPLEKTHTYFVAPYAKIDQKFVDVYDNDHIKAEYRMRQAIGGLDFGIEPWSFGEFRIGYQGGVIKPRIQKGDFHLPEETITRSGIRVRFIWDQADNINFPRKGYLAQVNFFASRPELGADDEYNKIDAKFSAVMTFNKKYTVIGTVRYASYIGPHLPFYDPATLGGFLNISGLAKDQLMGQRVGMGRLIFYKQMSKSLIGDLYLGGSIEAGNAWKEGERTGFQNLRYAGSAFVGFDSLFGPLYFAYGHADGGNNAVYLYLGRTF